MFSFSTCEKVDNEWNLRGSIAGGACGEQIVAGQAICLQ